MAKKVLIISTSLRTNSNSETLAKEAAKGASDEGNEVEFITLKNKQINFCKGCLSCQKTGYCVINDDAIEITEKMKNADVIIWATPVYYYEMSGQMKTLIDRANSLFISDYKFREIYVIATAADSEKGVVRCVIQGLNGWIACLHKTKLAGFIDGCGINNPLEIRQFPDIMIQAYELGRKIS